MSKGISHQQKIAIDRWFALPFAFLRLIGRIFQKSEHQVYNNVVIVKLFGMGSIVRIMHELQIRQVDLNKVTLITHQENAAIAKRLGFQTQVVGGDTFWQMALSAVRVRSLISNQENVSILDLERSSNLIGMFSHVMAFGKPLFGFGNEHWSRKGSQFLSPETKALQDLISLVFGNNSSDASNQVHSDTPTRKRQILINVNASEYLSERKFPAEKFVLLIENLAIAFPSMKLVLTGSENEKDYVNHVHSMLKNKNIEIENYAGAWSLKQLCDEIEHSHLLVTNDSGPMHLANYLRTRCVVIWGPTSPERIGYKNSELMLNLSLQLTCQPCFIHPKSEVAKSCSGAISCLNNMNVEHMSAQIVHFAKASQLASSNIKS